MHLISTPALKDFRKDSDMMMAYGSTPN